MQNQIRVCPHCGAGISSNAQFCRSCGKLVVEEKIGLPRQATPSMPGKCPSCEALISETAKFCRACGKPIGLSAQLSSQPAPSKSSAALSSERTCPHCGTSISATAKFCRACGKVFEPSVTEPITQGSASAPTKSAATPTPASKPPIRQSQLGATIAVGRSATQMASTLSSATAATLPLGWQTVVGNSLPSIAPLMANQAQAILSRQTASVGRSLRAPVLGLAGTSFIAMMTTFATQDTTSQLLACLQFVLTLAGVVTGLIANKQRNLVSLGTVLATLGVFQVQGCALSAMVQTAFTTPTPTAISSLLINGSTKLLCLVTALGTAWTAAKGDKRR